MIENPSVTCSTTSPSVIAAQSLAPRVRTKNETTSNATASNGMTPAPTIPWIMNPSSPTPAA